MLWKLHTFTKAFSYNDLQSLIRPHINYSYVIYNKIFNESWHKKLESAQYSAALAMAGVNRSTNTEILYHYHYWV